MDKTFEKVLIFGSRGMVGSAIVRRMGDAGLPPPVAAGRAEVDCLEQADVRDYIAQVRPSAIVVAAAKVGGIEANRTQPAAFLYENLMIATNIVDAAHRNNVPRLLFLGSSCIYPRMSRQPIPEEELLAGPLEPTNEGYAIAKIAGLKLCQTYRTQYGRLYHSAMPTNLYGPGDNYHKEHSHVLPALIRRFEEARIAGVSEVTMWGTGVALREFLHVDDLADAVIFLLRQPDPPDWVNVGTGEEVSIRTLAELVRDTCGAECKLNWDSSKPDGTPRKLLDCSRLNNAGWKPRIGLREGVARTIEDYRREGANRRQ